MRKITSLVAVVSLLSSPSFAQSGPKMGKNGGIGSSTSTYSDGEPTGGTYSINGTTGGAVFNSVTSSTPIPITSGGTGANTATNARTALGLGTASTQNTGTSGANVPLLNGGNSWSAKQSFPASSAASASMNIAQGVAPSSPNNGDTWVTSSGVYYHINGQTIGPLAWNTSRDDVNAATLQGVDPTGVLDSTTAIIDGIYNATIAGRAFYFPCGTYRVTSINVTNGAVIKGSAQRCVTIMGSTSTGDLMVIPSGTAQISNITLDRSVTATSGTGLKAADTTFPIIERVTVKNNYVGFWLGATARAYCIYCTAQSNYSDGFYFQDTAGFVATQWQLLYPLSELNNGWGFRTYLQSTTGLDTGQTFIAAGSYANTLGGFLFDGVSTSAMNDLIMVNPYSSSDGQNGFKFVRTGRFNQISSSFSELVGRTGTGRGQATPASNTGCGYSFDGTGLSNSSMTMDGIVSTGNSYAGMCVESSSGVKSFTMTNIRMVGNGASGSNNAGMILLDTSPRFIVSGAFIADDGFGSQANGIFFNNSTVAGNMIMSGAYIAGTTTGCNTAITNKAAVVGVGC